MPTIEVYSSKTSYESGETVQLHARSTSSSALAGPVYVTWHRLSHSAPSNDPFVNVTLTTTSITSLPYQSVPLDAAEYGCRWSPTPGFVRAASSLVSGLHQARLWIGPPPADTTGVAPAATAEFVIRPAAMAAAPNSARILCVWPFATKTAYNSYNGGVQGLGGDVYGGEVPAAVHPSENTLWRRRRSSALRPNTGRAMFGAVSIGDFVNEYCENRIYRFVERSFSTSSAVFSCSNFDLADPSFSLTGFNALVFMGHDEYWSDDMVARVRSFIDGGGNVLFLTGNTCWYRIRLEDSRTGLSVYKSALEEDTARLGVFSDSPANQTENAMSGVSYRFGAAQLRAPDTVASAYQVIDRNDWVFNGAPIQTNTSRQFFGTSDPAAGSDGGALGSPYPGMTSRPICTWETDSLEMRTVGGVPVPTGRDGTPLNFKVLADRQLHGPDTAIDGWNYVRGRATFGYYWKNAAGYCPFVAAAGTAGWGQRLLRASPDLDVERITLNLLSRAAFRQTLPPYSGAPAFLERTNHLPTKTWEVVPQAGLTSAALCISGFSQDGHLFALTGEGLWRRAPTYDDVTGGGTEPWVRWDNLPGGAGTPVAATHPYQQGPLHVVFKNGSTTQIYWRWPDPVTAWQPNGAAPIPVPTNTAGIAVGPTDGNTIFVLSDQALYAFDEALYAFPTVGSGYKRVGDATSVLRMTSLEDKLIGLTSDGRLVCRDMASGYDLTWIDFGAGPPVAASAVKSLGCYFGRLFALASDGTLYWRAVQGDDRPAQTGKLLFYNASSGAVAIGTHRPDGEYRHERDGNIGVGYSHIVARAPAPFSIDQGSTIVCYAKDSADGLAHTYDVARDGLMSNIGGNPVGRGYTHVVRCARDYLLFYNRTTRAGAVHRISGGNVLLHQNWGPGAFNDWTHIVVTSENNALFYNTSGWCETTYYDPALKTWNPLSSGWLAAGIAGFIPVGNNLVLALSAGNPGKWNAHLYRLVRNGAPPYFPYLRDLGTFEVPYGDVYAGGSNGGAVLYTSTSGALATGGVIARTLASDPQNGWLPLVQYPVGSCSLNWSSITPI